MKVLITGGNGFTGKKLFEYLNTKSELELVTITRDDCDLSQYSKLELLLKAIEPTQIYHLAGSDTNRYDYDYQNNVLTTKNIFDAVLKLKLDCRILLIGSAAEYGFIDSGDNPIRETYPLNPVSFYGITKVFQTELMKLYNRLHDINAVLARPFNLTGSGIAPKLFIGKVYEQIELYKNKKIAKITLGNLQNKRDYISIENAVQYYELIMNKGKSGEIYNVGSGKAIKMVDLLKQILNDSQLNLSIVEEKVLDSKNKIDVSNIYANIDKVTALKSL